jgi:hypothetical protein
MRVKATRLAGVCITCGDRRYRLEYCELHYLERKAATSPTTVPEAGLGRILCMACGDPVVTHDLRTYCPEYRR